MDPDDGIREGFICPICMKDLESPLLLTSHFEESHSEDKDVLQQLKGIFGKAKRKILRHNENEHENEQGFYFDGAPSTSGEGQAARSQHFMNWEPQEFGASRSHLDDFRKLRDTTIESNVVETNKILIRLEKLLQSGIHVISSPLLGRQNSIRKSREKQVVPWTSDSDVKFCTKCMKQFSMTRRKHHCRLCGNIMCAKCSEFLPFQIAISLVKMDGVKGIPPPKAKNNNGEDEDGLRICIACDDLLVRHSTQQREKQSKPTIIILYEKMKVLMIEADKLFPGYMKMAESLYMGETRYDLESTTEARLKLLKVYESIDAISKQIAALGTHNGNTPNPHSLKLQKGIRKFASNYIQDNMFTLPSLPSLDKIIQLQTERKTRLARQEAMERAEREKAAQQYRQFQESKRDSQASGSNTPNTLSRGTADPSVGKGWGPVSVTTGSSPDPMVQQMEIIQNYITQARKEKRFDEVEMLEKNLNDLRLAYSQQNSQR